MDYKLLCLLMFAGFSSGFCATIPKLDSEPEKTLETNKSSRTITLESFITCGLTRDVSCFLDTAEALVEEKKADLLAQADREVAVTGRADDENAPPSHLSKAISRIISEITDLFKEGLYSFFKTAREGEDDEVEESEDGTKQEVSGRRSEPRAKKKIKKLIALIKLAIIGLLIFLKIKLLLKIAAAILQVKFFLVALAGLILNAARFYLDLKKKHQPQKVIYYEHAQHQHHYEGGEDDWSSGPGGGYWGRSYDEEGADSAHDLAYAKQKPYRRVEKNKSDSSWFG